MLGALERLRLRAAEDLHHLVAHDAQDRLVGREALEHVLPGGAGAHAIDDLLRDLEVDVRLEEGEADLAQRGLDLGLGEDTLAAEGLEYPLEPLAERLEHADHSSAGRMPSQSK